jgi:hypothetical protein
MEVTKMNDLTPTIGVGVGDLQMAATREVRRLMRQAKGDRNTAVKLLLERLQELGYIKESDLKGLQRITELGFSSSGGKISANEAYSEVRQIYDEMLAGGKSSPTALVIASASAGAVIGGAVGGIVGKIVDEC